ncbi:MAG: alkaline phosphatase family protein [Chitinophagales bacterium]|nr:alkaline phosphatase family protein [Chitinophagales bacterium]MDW8419769.1 alkaline phosphatase D family protein [Chitinophagales bacterium]
MKLPLTVIWFCVVLLVQAQKEKKPRLLAGPVIGNVTSTTARIWIGYRGKGSNALILGDTAEKRVYYPTSYRYIHNAKGEIALTMDFTGLKPNHTYNIICSIEGFGTHARYSFKTDKDEEAPAFNFLLGSCNLLQYDYTRGVFPGGSNWIFYYMRRKKPDFMVWLGDNVYYFYQKDWQNYEGMFRRQMKTRKVFNKFYRNFLGNQPNYAIWDDHDYGPNDSNRNFALKDTSLLVFRGFWPNVYPENENLRGNYFSFRKYDCEFFMLDGRYYRAPQGDTAGDFLGEQQLTWLKSKLLSSDATFKFICLGTQVLNNNPFGESYCEYPRERNDLLDFIAKNNVRGVIFLTGDKHYSEVSKMEWKGYPFYDITCSPLTAPPLPRRIFGAYHNDYRITGTDYPFRNFGRIIISGPKGNRTCTFQIFGRSGVKRREWRIHQSELTTKSSP